MKLQKQGGKPTKRKPTDPLPTLQTVFQELEAGEKEPMRNIEHMPPLLPVPRYPPNTTRSALSAIAPPGHSYQGE